MALVCQQPSENVPPTKPPKSVVLAAFWAKVAWAIAYRSDDVCRQLNAVCRLCTALFLPERSKHSKHASAGMICRSQSDK